MEKTWLQKQNTGLYCRPRRPNRGPTAGEWKKLGCKSKILGFIAAPAGLIAAHSRRMEKTWLQKQNTRLYCRPRRPNRGPTAGEWKKLGCKSKILGFIAASAGLIAAHSRRMEKTWVKKQNTGLYCRRRRPNRGPTAGERKKTWLQKQTIRLYCRLRKPLCSSITVEWKNLG